MIKKINDTLEAIFSPINLKKRFPSYVFGRPVFYGFIALLSLTALFIGQSYGFSENTYFSCEFGVCTTPEGATVTAPYEEGIKPPFVVNNFDWLALGGLACCFGINHLIYNMR